MQFLLSVRTSKGAHIVPYKAYPTVQYKSIALGAHFTKRPNILRCCEVGWQFRSAGCADKHVLYLDHAEETDNRFVSTGKIAAQKECNTTSFRIRQTLTTGTPSNWGPQLQRLWLKAVAPANMELISMAEPIFQLLISCQARDVIQID